MVRFRGTHIRVRRRHNVIHFEKRARLPVVAPLPLALAGLWLAGLFVLWSLDGSSAKACLLYDFSGLPCPGCGGSRAGLSLLRGDLLGAILYNPLVTLALCGGTCILALRLSAGRQLVMDWSHRAVRLVPAILVAAVLANWIYVLSRH